MSEVALGHHAVRRIAGGRVGDARQDVAGGEILLVVVARGVRTLEPEAGAQQAETAELPGRLEGVAPDAVCVELVVARHVAVGQCVLLLVHVGVLQRRVRGAVPLRRVLAGDGLVGVRVRVEVVVGLPAVAPAALDADVVHVRALALGVVAPVALAARIVVQRVVLAECVHLGQRGAVDVVRRVRADVVDGGEQRQHGGFAERALVLHRQVLAGDRVVCQVAVAVHALRIDLQGGIAALHAAALEGDAFQVRAPGTQRGVDAGQARRRRRLREHVDAAAVGRVTQVAGVARTALDHHAADHRGREIRGRMVGGAVGVAERDAVEGDVVFAVLEATQRHLLVGQARAVGGGRGCHAGRDRQDGVEVAGGRRRVLDERARDDGLRLGGAQVGLRRCHGGRGAGVGVDGRLRRGASAAADGAQVHRVGVRDLWPDRRHRRDGEQHLVQGERAFADHDESPFARVSRDG